MPTSGDDTSKPKEDMRGRENNDINTSGEDMVLRPLPPCIPPRDDRNNTRQSNGTPYRIPSTTMMELSHLTLHTAYARQVRIHMTQMRIQDMKVTTKANKD